MLQHAGLAGSGLEVTIAATPNKLKEGWTNEQAEEGSALFDVETQARIARFLRAWVKTNGNVPKTFDYYGAN